MAIVPTPPAQPINPGVPATQIPASWGLSSVPASNPAGNESGAYCSSMYIRGQQLLFHYRRVPIGSINFNPGDITLSSVNLGGVIDRTALKVFVQFAAYAYVVSGECWPTTNFHQTQKFEIDTAAQDGLTYGTPGAGMMGVAGEIYNSASGIYISRQPYANETWLETYNEQGTGTNFVVVDASGSTACYLEDSYQNAPTNILMNLFTKTDSHFTPFFRNVNTANFCGTTINKFRPEVGTKPGAYSTSQDTSTDVKSITDTIGQMVHDGTLTHYSNNDHDYWGIYVPAATHYNPGHHYWGP
tara:strand:- start:1028 stop:1927 length:900 start_codon:yes stop_codon:yes gene_type:complete